MPDQRKHRGPHPEDRALFSDSQLPRLRAATDDLCWLLSRNYASNSALKLVGDRYSLDARQRVAIARCACGENAFNRRREHEVSSGQVQDEELWIDGFNVLTSVEAALADGVILHAHDGCYRDMASMHGTYRRVEETDRAIEVIGEALMALKPAACRWLLDQPVSNSGRLKTRLRELAEENHWEWHVQLVPDPDSVLARATPIIATADSQILDTAERWFNLAKQVIDSHVRDPWILDLSGNAE